MLRHSVKPCLLLTACLVCGSTSKSAQAQFINFAFSGTNSQPTDVPFALNLSVPTTLMPAGGTLVLTLNGSLTDASGNGVSATPSPGLFLLSGGGNGTSYVSTGPAFSIPGGAAGGVYTYPVSTTSVVTPVDLTSLDAKLSFNLSGLGDSAGFTGSLRYVAATATPEPGAIALLLGTGISGGLLRFSKSKRK